MIKFTGTSLNILPDGSGKTRPVEGVTNLSVQQNRNTLTFLFKFKSPELLKYRTIKLASFNYGTIKAADLKMVRKAMGDTYNLVFGQRLDPIEELKRQTVQLERDQEESTPLSELFAYAMADIDDRSPKTLENYRRAFDKIVEIAGDLPSKYLDHERAVDILKVISRGWHDIAVGVFKMIERQMIQRKLIPGPVIVYGVKLKGSKPNLKALEQADYQGFLAQLDAMDNPIEAAVIKFMLLTGCRIEQVLSATWSELQGSVWVIDASRIKRNRQWDDSKPYLPHALPVTPRMREVLEHMRCFGQDGYIFKSVQHGRKISASTINRRLKALGCDLSTHNLRKTVANGLIRTCGSEAEKLILDHGVEGVSARYVSDQALERKRRYLLHWHEELYRTESVENNLYTQPLFDNGS